MQRRLQLSTKQGFQVSRKLIYFSSKPNERLGSFQSEFDCQHFDRFDAFLQTEARPDVFLIQADTGDYSHDILTRIRGHGDYYCDLCFVDGEIAGSDKLLSDGGIPDPDALASRLSEVEDLHAAFKRRDEPLYRDDRLLKYLWLRPGFVIRAHYDWSSPGFYSYPLLEALSFSEIDVRAWLRNLSLKKFLDKQELQDRQRECPHCRSTHLSFIDVCPNCQSIDIEKQISLHCFVCGQVGPQQEFLRNGVLICPKCETHLRQIGSDYDRPIENYSCRQCDHFFDEGDVLARCAVCSRSMAVEDLVVNKIYAWKLSELGQIVAIRGAMTDILSIFTEMNFVPQELFLHNLDWILLQAERYPECTFSMLGLYFVNLQQMVDMLGSARVLQKVEGFAERVRESLRKPDLCTRSTENMVWLLLPQTGSEGLSSLKTRLERSIEQLQEADAQKLVCEFASFSSEQRNAGENAELLLARLRSELI